MADFVNVHKSRSFMSSLTHVILNLLLAVSVVALTALTENPVLGLILVILSKWRVFAVRRRYFFTNLKANLVDYIVGFSIVLLTFAAGQGALVADIIYIIIYAIWLLFIKPKSSETAAEIQALFAVLLGTSAAVQITSGLNSIALVLIEFIIGFASARHVVVQSDEKDTLLTTLVSGLVFAEISQISYYWSIFYTFEPIRIFIPALAIILTIFSFVYNRIRRTVLENGDSTRFRDIAAPAIFGFLTVTVIFIWFSVPNFNY